MKKLIRKITHPFFKRYHFWYHRKPRKYIYNNIYTIVQPTVFSPINTQSTKVFLDFINKIDLKNKSVLELGCGSGIISILSASKNGIVTATDINEAAIKSLKKMATKQGFKINTIISDLFDKISIKNFDFIFINPPFYPKKPKDVIEKAWFCGNNFEYFEQLFEQLPQYLTKTSNCFMILSNDCDYNSINSIALKNHLLLEKVFKKNTRLEVNYIYKINKI